jgi:hypothetical protein
MSTHQQIESLLIPLLQSARPCGEGHWAIELQQITEKWSEPPTREDVAALVKRGTEFPAPASAVFFEMLLDDVYERPGPEQIAWLLARLERSAAARAIGQRRSGRRRRNLGTVWP